MHSRNHGRVCLSVAFCLFIFLYILITPFGITVKLFGIEDFPVGQRIGNSSLGFEAIFAINAPWRVNRKDSLTLAAAYSGISLKCISLVNESHVDERAYPQGNHRILPKGSRGSWRAHMDTIRIIIERNLSTALIFDDNVDWDQSVREQLEAFGRASRRLPHMIARADLVAHSILSQDLPAHQQPDQDIIELAKHSMLLLPTVPYAQPPKPYGDDWDVLWLGHCGTSLPPHHNSSALGTPSDRLMLLDNATIPNIDPSPSSVYPPRTRIYHRSHATSCVLAYAVTQHGARKIMYEHGIRNFDRDYGTALSEWCDGLTKHIGGRPMCLTSIPSVFVRFEGHEDSKESGSTGAGSDEVKKESLVKSVRKSLGEGLNGKDL